MITNNDVKWAVIPAAGRGTRFLPITKGVSKEMLNIVDRPTLDYIIDECLKADITNIVLIVSKEKEDIRKYYSLDEEFYDEMIKAKKYEYAKIIDSIPKKANFYFVTQYEMLGLGHAVLQAKDIIGKNNFVVCCGDDITSFDDVSPISELVEAFKKVGGKTIVGGKEVKKEDISKYGSMDIKNKIDDNIYELKGIVEKPKEEEAPSLFASLGKWVFNYHIFEELENTKPGLNNEIQLTDAIANIILHEGAYFSKFKATRYDCGDKLGYLKAVVHFALKRDDLKEEFIKFLESEINNYK